jgi:internalin A
MRTAVFALAAALTVAACDDNHSSDLLSKFDGGAATTPDAAAELALAKAMAAASASATPSATAAAPRIKASDCKVAASGPLTFTDKALEKETLRKLQRDPGTPLTRADLAQVHSLNLTLYGRITQLDPCMIPLYTGLKEIFVGEGDVDDLSPLSNLSLLETIRIALNKVSDLTPIEKLTRLDRLDVSHTNVHDLKSVAYFANLTEIMLDEDNVTDLTPLAGLKKLEVVSIRKTPVKDLSPLKDLHKLKKLSIGGAATSDYGALQSLVSGGLKIDSSTSGL